MSDDINTDPADIVYVRDQLALLASECETVQQAFTGVGAAAFGPTAAGALTQFHRDGAQSVESAELQQILTSNVDIDEVFQSTVVELDAVDEVSQYEAQLLVAQIFQRLGLSGLFGNGEDGPV